MPCPGCASLCLVLLPSPLGRAHSLYRLVLLLVLSPRMPSAIFFRVSFSSLYLLLLPPLLLSGPILFALFPLPLLFCVMIFLLWLHGVRLLFLLHFTSVMCNFLQILGLLWVLLLLRVQLFNWCWVLFICYTFYLFLTIVLFQLVALVVTPLCLPPFVVPLRQGLIDFGPAVFASHLAGPLCLW